MDGGFGIGRQMKGCLMDEKFYFSDNPTNKDQLKFNDYLPAMRGMIESGVTPINIGIFGPWGSGKTSLMQMLMAQISDDQIYKKVWFTAWKYDRQESLWRALILRVIDALYPKDKDGNRISASEDKEIKKGLQCLERMERSLYQDVIWETKGDWTLNLNKTAKGLASLPAWLLFHLAGMGDLSKELGIKPEFAEMVERNVKQHTINQLNSMEAFEATFKEAVNLILGKEGKLIVFIDDLDRCLPEKTIQILEAVKLFLNVEGTVFVLGMDHEIIQKGIELHYRNLFQKFGIEEDYPIDGNSYLQKIIQVPFNIPYMSSKSCSDYVKVLEKGLSSSFLADDLRRSTMNIFQEGMIPNPRQIKRTLNVFLLLQNIALEQEKNGTFPGGSVSSPLLAKTVLIQIQWPKLYQEWCRYPMLIQVLEEKYRLIQKAEITERISPESNPLENRYGELIAPYVSNWKTFGVLEKLLCCPEETDEDFERASFLSLNRMQIERYLSLASTGDILSEERLFRIGDLVEELKSGDEVKIKSILSEIDQIEIDPAGPKHTKIRNVLLSLMNSPEIELENRRKIGDELGRIGDSRFEESWLYFPKDDFLGFVKVLGVNDYLCESITEEGNNNKEFYIAKYPVTVDQFRYYLRRKGKSEKEYLLINQDAGNRPMRYMDYHSAIFYIDWLNQNIKNIKLPNGIAKLIEAGWHIGLPSAEEMRASVEYFRRIVDVNEIGEFSLFANTKFTGPGHTTPVGLFSIGEDLPLYDIYGNVWEWTKTDGKYAGKILCGGSYKSILENLDNIAELEENPSNRKPDIGLRLALHKTL